MPGVPGACYAPGGLAAARGLAAASALEGAEKPAQPEFSEILRKAGKRALGGGIAGAMAMGINVTTLMWIRTTINYQYRYGLSTGEALRTLYKEGGGGVPGVLRFYRGYVPAMMQGPLSRFGDTASNAGALALMEQMESTKNLNPAIKTLGASAVAASFRIFITPLDTWKTTFQVEGKNGGALLANKIRRHGPFVMWHGALGAAGATFVGHYPWFVTYNTLDEYLPKYDRKKEMLPFLGVSAVKGFCASAVSDSISNPIRVLKVYRQTNADSKGYIAAAGEIYAKEGVGAFYRGLRTKIVANGLQGILFSIAWKYIEDVLRKKD